MTERNNVLSLHDQGGLEMSAEKPTFYTIEELLERYPIILQRGWDKEDLDLLVRKDIIIGKWQEENPAVLEVEKESIEAFLAYHNKHILARVKRVEAGLENLKKSPSKK